MATLLEGNSFSWFILGHVCKIVWEVCIYSWIWWTHSQIFAQRIFSSPSSVFILQLTCIFSCSRTLVIGPWKVLHLIWAMLCGTHQQSTSIKISSSLNTLKWALIFFYPKNIKGVSDMVERIQLNQLCHAGVTYSTAYLCLIAKELIN